jgi:hypothetical protein
MNCFICGQPLSQWQDSEDRLYCNNPECEGYKKIKAKRLFEKLLSEKS